MLSGDSVRARVGSGKSSDLIAQLSSKHAADPEKLYKCAGPLPPSPSC